MDIWTPAKVRQDFVFLVNVEYEIQLSRNLLKIVFEFVKKKKEDF